MPVTRNGVLRVHAGPVVTSIACPCVNVISSRPRTVARRRDTVTPRVPSCSREPSHTAHHVRPTGPTCACATHSITSAAKAPTQVHDFCSAIDRNDMLSD